MKNLVAVFRFKKIFILLLALIITGCNESESGSNTPGSNTPEIQTKLLPKCSEDVYINSALYGLDENFNETRLLRKKDSSRGSYLLYDTKDIYEKHLLFKCSSYEKHPYIRHDTYSSIIHKIENEFWFNDKVACCINLKPNYRASYLSELYYKIYTKLFKQGYTHDQAKNTSNHLLKKAFPDYPGINIGAANEASKDDYDHFHNSLKRQIKFAEIYTNLKSSAITSVLSAQILNKDKQIINSYLLAAFLEDNQLTSVSKSSKFENELDWSKNNLINSYSTGNSSFYYDERGEKHLSLNLTSSRGEHDKTSILSYSQITSISSYDNRKLYFILEADYMKGLDEKTTFGFSGCSGVAAVVLEYLNHEGKEVGASILVNMTDSVILGSLLYNTADTLESNSYRNVIRVGSESHRRIALKLSEEMTKIRNISSIDTIKSVRMMLVVSDFFTDGYYYVYGQELPPSCNQAKAKMDIKRAGVYLVRSNHPSQQ